MVVYKTTNLINGKIYIGQDSNNNPYYLGSGKLIIKALKAYGRENFKKEILCECLSREELNEKEIFWIKKLNSIDRTIGYNIALGGSGECGYTPKGRIFTEEWKAKISKAKLGHKTSEETKEKLRQFNLGKKLSEEHKAKMRGIRGRQKRFIIQNQNLDQTHQFVSV